MCEAGCDQKLGSEVTVMFNVNIYTVTEITGSSVTIKWFDFHVFCS